MTSQDGSLGFVVIGRNEGARLAACLASVLRHTSSVIYVDSGSTDDSVALARDHGVPVVELDASIKFTAARARNSGVDALRRRVRNLTYVHFIDGDCELVDGWVETAMAVLREQRDLAAVCGRRKERYPERSPYNHLCDKEWNTPVGIAPTTGGDALFRLKPFLTVGGFSDELIAGEEPDLCHRLRQSGWQIRRIDRDMTIHDAAMTHFRQWWQRNRRSGYATAEALVRRGDGGLRRQVISNMVWSLPLAWPLWPFLWLRLFLRRGALEASYLTLGKLPHLQGQIDYWRSRRTLIEYK